ncbi:MAG: response regulator [Elusimicrobiota bacterium]
MKKRIMVIEDDPVFQELLTMLLSKEFEATVCASVEESLPRIEAGGYQLVISDINLLGMTGFEILDRMRQSGLLETCPVVLCSSQFDAATKEKALSLGAAGFIAKPYEPEAVLAMVRSLLA